MRKDRDIIACANFRQFKNECRKRVLVYVPYGAAPLVQQENHCKQNGKTCSVKTCPTWKRWLTKETK